VLARGDPLVDLSPEHSLLGVISLRQDLEDLLGCSVDVTEEWMSQKKHPCIP
jgi:predicted nucleotidyltransferase